TKAWSSTLNKSCEKKSTVKKSDSNSNPKPSSSSSSSPVKIRFDLNKARENILRVKEKYIRDEIEKDPWYHYSLRYRRRQQREKLKQISNQQQQTQQNNVDQQQVDESISNNDDLCNDNEFYLDKLNESISNLILDVDKSHHYNVDDNSQQDSSMKSNNKRPIFMLSEECQEMSAISSSPTKRHRTMVDNKPPMERKIFKHKGNNIKDAPTKQPELDPFMFFDHIKTLDFESNNSGMIFFVGLLF
ncbi:hypothetical protein BLA29_009876, partial [Euroglyphus maynei]